MNVSKKQGYKKDGFSGRGLVAGRPAIAAPLGVVRRMRRRGVSVGKEALQEMRRGIEN